MPLLSSPIPVYDANEAARNIDYRSLRAALTRFEKKHGADALISFMKVELERRGEIRWRLEKLAPHPGDRRGQTSILDAGR